MLLLSVVLLWLLLLLWLLGVVVGVDVVAVCGAIVVVVC